MPINGQMTLMDVVKAGQEGVEWGQRQAAIKRERQAQKTLMEADQEAARVFERSKAEWAANGAQGQWVPTDETKMRAAEARGIALARAGDWQSYLKNEGTVAGLRTMLRGRALQEFEVDGDIEKLLRRHHATVFDGRDIVAVEKLPGADAVEQLPAQAPAILVRYSDGSEAKLDPRRVVGAIKTSLADPAKAAEEEIKFNFSQMLERFKGDQKVEQIRVEGQERRATEQVKGGEDRATAGYKHDLDVGLAGVKFGHDRSLARERFGHEKSLADINNTAAQTRTETSASATRDAATTGANARVEAARLGREGKDADDDGKTYKAIHDEVIRITGQRMQGPLGGTRIGDTATAQIARAAQMAEQQQGLSRADAINGAINAWLKRNPAPGERAPRK